MEISQSSWSKPVMKGLGVVVLLIIQLVGGAKLPEKWKRCSPGDGWLDCMKEAVEFAVTTTARDGLKTFGIPSLDPMHFDTLLIDQSTGPVSIKLEFKDIDVTGMKDLIVDSVTGDWNKLELAASIPVPLSLTGGYTVEGKVLTLPIIGSGHCNLTFHDFKYDPIFIKFKQETRKGKRYILIDEMSLTPRTSLLEMEFQNLFNGDKLLGKQMNIFLNENWNEIFDELKPAVSLAFGTAYRDVGNRILSRVTAEEVMT